MTDQPFAGVEVVELGQFVAVPYCAQLLADGGAHVVKVEPLDGEPTRHLAPLAPGATRHFLSRNRGKQCLPVDLRHPATAAVLDRLVERADVLLLNLRPGLAAEHGLDAAALRARYPRLVVGNVTAFGKQGPDAALPGMDIVVQARSGLMASMGRMVNALPAVGDSPIADYMAACLLAFGVSSALYRRERTGEGAEVDVSLLAAALALQNTLILRVEAADGEAHAELREWLAQARAAGVPFAEQAAHSHSVRTVAMTSVYYRTYATSDAAIAIACASAGLQRRLLALTGLSDDALGASGPRELLTAHYHELQTRMEALFRGRSTAEWKAALDAQGIPASAVLLPVELLEDEQAKASGLLHDQHHPLLGGVRLLGSPLELDQDGFHPGPPAAPLGSESRQILAGLGFTPAAVDALVAAGAVRAQQSPGE